jgi:hypothetical protein
VERNSSSLSSKDDEDLDATVTYALSGRGTSVTNVALDDVITSSIVVRKAASKF